MEISANSERSARQIGAPYARRRTQKGAGNGGGNAVVLPDAATEIFLTSTAGGVIPVTLLDGRPVGDGKPGRITMLLRKRYWEAHEEERWTTPAEYPVQVRAG